MHDPQAITVKAHVHLTAPELGGRPDGIYSGYRPNHNFGGPEAPDFYLGQIETLGGEDIAPGCEGTIKVRFVFRPELRELLRPGREWRLQEALRLVGVAKVIEVLDDV